MTKKLERLKGKIFEVEIKDDGFFKVVHEDDIYSASEWLKQIYYQIDNHLISFWSNELQTLFKEYKKKFLVSYYAKNNKQQMKKKYENNFKIWLVDKAFDDVTKNV